VYTAIQVAYYCIAGKKVVRALYKYEPSACGDETENDLSFNKGDYMVAIRE